VRKDLRARRLVSAAPPELPHLQMTMDVRICRERRGPREGGRDKIDALWDFLVERNSAAQAS